MANQALRSFVDDVLALWGEIADFGRRSAEVCEAGRRPWLQALGAALGFGVVTSGLAIAAVRRPVAAPLAGGYWLARTLAVRWLAGIYLVAFLVAYFQNKELIGDLGILPARALLERADAAAEVAVSQAPGKAPLASWERRVRRLVARIELLPTLLWLARDRRRLDRWLDGLAVTGAVLAAIAVVRGGASAWHLLALWLLYHSINAVGQRWYSFGWEAQLLETGLLALLAAPAGLLGCWSPGAALSHGAAPPWIAPWVFKWMAFRIMLGAGLIKLRGAKCWLDLTAMCYHIETQPMPNPFSRFLHNMPRGAHLFSTATNHLIELAAPWLLLLPFGPFTAVFGAAHIIFQATLILSGNLSFLNWLTIVPGIWCFDDALLVGLLPETLARDVANAVAQAEHVSVSTGIFGVVVALLGLMRSAVAVSVILWLSLPVLTNLLGPQGGVRQRMNSSFERRILLPPSFVRALGWLLDNLSGAAGGVENVRGPYYIPSLPKKRRTNADGHEVYDDDEQGLSMDLCSLRLLNTYGAFGSVNRERVEIIFEGFDAKSGTWLPYTFKAAVDDPLKRPQFWAPYHLRLDWCRWIASCRGRRANGLEEKWVLAFAGKLLSGDAGTRRLLASGGDPFEGAALPRCVRAELYLYRFAAKQSEPYWIRERVGQYLPPLTLRELGPRLLEWGLWSAPPS